MQEKKPRTTTAGSEAVLRRDQGRMKPLAESTSRFEGSEWDAFSGQGPLESHPILSRKSGMQFPFRTEEGALPAIDAGSAPLA